MKRLIPLASAALLIAGSLQAQTRTVAVRGASNPFIASQEVAWTTLGKDETSSMPIGNGDLAANVWTEKNGDLVLLLAKSDAWAETGKLLKLGRVRLHFSPNPFADTTRFMQVLQLKTGTVEIKSGSNVVQVWVDANHPSLHVEARLDQSSKLHAALEPWRKMQHLSEARSQAEGPGVLTGMTAPKLGPDIAFPGEKDRITWCHFNAGSYYSYILRQEHLESLIPKYTDPLYHRCFGAAISGPGLVRENDLVIASKAGSKNLRLDITGLTRLQSNSPEAWKTAMDLLVKQSQPASLQQQRREHESWWKDFWNRSWIQVDGSEEAEKVSLGYSMQRYLVAASSRGETPVKFNGGLFTVGHDVEDTARQTAEKHDPDYRRWGDCYWNQNNRLLYWPLIATGDTDLLRPWFDMYLKTLAFQKERCQLYYHHAGASYPETMHFWGVPRIEDFGRDNPTNEIRSHWQRYHIQGSLEVIAQMLDVNEHYPDAGFVITSIVPFADAILSFYDQHWKRDETGKIRMAPMQSLETYQDSAVNPTPDIAGLMSVIPRLLALPEGSSSTAQREGWRKLLRELPPIPVGKTAKGKVPPLGMGDEDGRPNILPAAQYGKPGNSENPELYVAFPYRLYGVGKPGLQLAQNTFAARKSPQNTCWGQDGTQAAILGLTPVAKTAVIAEFTNYGDQRFQWFWKSAHDWTPDLDNGGSGMITLQSMLMQCEGQRIRLLPSWPKDWQADFRLHAPMNTVVEGHVQDGKVTYLKVTPESRKKDVVVVASE